MAHRNIVLEWEETILNGIIFHVGTYKGKTYAHIRQSLRGVSFRVQQKPGAFHVSKRRNADSVDIAMTLCQIFVSKPIPKTIHRNEREIFRRKANA